MTMAETEQEGKQVKPVYWRNFFAKKRRINTLLLLIRFRDKKTLKIIHTVHSITPGDNFSTTSEMWLQ